MWRPFHSRKTLTARSMFCPWGRICGSLWSFLLKIDINLASAPRICTCGSLLCLHNFSHWYIIHDDIRAEGLSRFTRLQALCHGEMLEDSYAKEETIFCQKFLKYHRPTNLILVRNRDLGISRHYLSAKWRLSAYQTSSSSLGSKFPRKMFKFSLNFPKIYADLAAIFKKFLTLYLKFTWYFHKIFPKIVISGEFTQNDVTFWSAFVILTKYSKKYHFK